MNNIYEEAYKEAERKIKKFSEDFKKDLDKIFKECTKNKPEVGDVWKNKYGEEAHILWVGYVVVYIRKYWITNYEYHYEVCKLDYDKFIRKWTYLGKSKANINDLFKTENGK